MVIVQNIMAGKQLYLAIKPFQHAIIFSFKVQTIIESIYIRVKLIMRRNLYLQ